MHLVDMILKDVEDNTRISAHGKLSAALISLAQTCNVITQRTNGTALMLGVTTCGELKAALKTLNPDEQIALLSSYNNAHPDSTLTVTTHVAPPADDAPAIILPVDLHCPAVPTEDPKVVEARKLRTWLVKAMVIMIAPVPCLVGGAMLAMAARNGTMPDSVVLTGLLTTATELLKLLVTL